MFFALLFFVLLFRENIGAVPFSVTYRYYVPYASALIVSAGISMLYTGCDIKLSSLVLVGGITLHISLLVWFGFFLPIMISIS